MDSPGNVVARLIVTVQGKTISTLDVPKGACLVIGRGNDVHYQIKSGALSRRHCQIRDEGNALSVQDLDSLNGTFVNRVKVRKTSLKSGDEIQIGPVCIKIELAYETISQATPISPIAIQTQQVSESTSNPKPLVVMTPLDKGSSGSGEPQPPANNAPLSNNASNPTHYSNRNIFEEDFPSGNCVNCSKLLTSKELATHAGIFRENLIYCLNCFCEGAGDFPTIAGYRIIKKLGGGGMGDVYEAIQLSMERPVAFKLMRGLEHASEAQIRRFFREARTGGKLSHPNIVNFIDAGKIEGAHYIAMEFIYGIDVRQIIQEKGPIPYPEAARIGYYVSLALDYAHTRFNIVHRDIKPENILIDRDNMIKLTDFGLAKNLEEAGLSGITKSQTGVGTLFYMAPEQILEARFADQRADVYSLGVSLYEMLCGRKPFTADQMMALVNKIRYEEAQPLASLVPQIPPEMCAIIHKAMAKNADQRFQTIKEMMLALKPYMPVE